MLCGVLPSFEMLQYSPHSPLFGLHTHLPLVGRVEIYVAETLPIPI